MSAFADLILAASAAASALRSYQYGNTSTELAEEIAAALEAAIVKTLENRGEDLAAISAQCDDLNVVLKEIAALVRRRVVEQ